MGLSIEDGVREVQPHEQGVWYESPAGVVFQVVGEVKRVLRSDNHIADVQLFSGEYTRLAWGPGTQRRPSRLARAWRAVSCKLRGVPVFTGRTIADDARDEAAKAGAS